MIDARAVVDPAAKIDAEAKAVAAVDLKDEKLVKFRNDYAENLKKLALNVRDLSKLQAKAKDPKATARPNTLVPTPSRPLTVVVLPAKK